MNEGDLFKILEDCINEYRLNVGLWFVYSSLEES